MKIPGLILAATLVLSPVAGGAAPAVVTDIAPVASLVAQVMGDTGKPVLLIPPGNDGHHHQLRPSEARSIANADLLVWIGPALTPWLEGAAKSLPAEKQIILLEQPETILRLSKGGQDDGHAPDHDAAHADGHDHDHDHGPTDPHAWLAPENARLWLSVIAAALSDSDPANAAVYNANAEAAAERIAAVATEARLGLKDYGTVPFVVRHDAYGYFTDSMGLPEALAIADLSGNAPSAGGMRDLHRKITETATVCFHPEAGSGPRQMAALQDLGLTEGAALDPTGLGEKNLQDLYVHIIKGMSEAIAACPVD